MNGNCHFVYGVAVATALSLNIDKLSTFIPALTVSPENVTLLIFGGLLGGIFPDIDNPTSYVGKLSSPLSNGIGKISEVTGKTGFNHRGIFHDPIIYLIGLFLCCKYFSPLIGFFVGCLSHLLLDMFNPIGIPFLFGIKRLRLAKIPSASKEGIVFTWFSVAFTLILGLLLKLSFLF